ncbi:MAG: excinuclease ABC subunit C protein [uncultured bacterium]|nr:MAG: excinuclease ABC subunit C protein [uncultured bacterium]HBR79354.1 endonuclease [Candidatus Moranbacteria bacterium]
MYYVYILKCADETLYTGITTDLKRRLVEHNSSKLGARYTKMRRPVFLMWFEKSKNKSTALIRESQVKKLSRIKKLELIKNLSQ